MYFYLYSDYGGTRPGVLRMRSVAAALAYPMMESASLEDPIKISIPPLDHLQHLTIQAHGVPGAVLVSDLKTGRPVKKNAEEFAEFLYDRLEASSEGASQHLKSILFTSCRLACRTERSPGASNQSEISFPDDFARSPRTRTLFPELEHIIVSPYRTGTAPNIYDSSEMFIDVRSGNDRRIRESLRISVDTERFFAGDLPDKLLKPPSLGRVHSVYKRVPQESVAGGQVDHKRSMDPETISDFISSHNFTESVFHKIPVPPLITVTPPTD